MPEKAAPSPDINWDRSPEGLSWESFCEGVLRDSMIGESRNLGKLSEVCAARWLANDGCHRRQRRQSLPSTSGAKLVAVSAIPSSPSILQKRGVEVNAWDMLGFAPG